jgi:hypothetical protein
MSENNTCTLVGSDKGGVGKSFLSQLLVQAYDRVQRPLKVIEVDHQRKLTSVLGSRVNLSLDATPSVSAGRADRHAAEAFYNPVYEAWTQGESLTDLGANVTTPVLEWARVHDIATLAEDENVHFRFVAMATPDDQALRSAARAIEDARRSLGERADIFLVLNVVSEGAGFRPYHNTDEWRHVTRLVQTHRVTICEIPLCDSVLLEYGRSQGLTVINILAMDNAGLAALGAACGLDRITLRTHYGRLKDWIKEFQVALAPLLSQQRQGAFRQAAE